MIGGLRPWVTSEYEHEGCAPRDGRRQRRCLARRPLNRGGGPPDVAGRAIEEEAEGPWLEDEHAYHHALARAGRGPT